MATARSEVLQIKIIEAHEKLWARIIELNNLPAPYGAVLGFLSILEPSEMDMVKKKPGFQFSSQDDDFLQLLRGNEPLDLIRPFVDNHLWEMARARIAFTFRLVLMISTDGPTSSTLSNWSEDALILQHLRTTFSEKTLESFDYSQVGTIQRIMSKWDQLIVSKIKEAYEGLQA